MNRILLFALSSLLISGGALAGQISGQVKIRNAEGNLVPSDAAVTLYSSNNEEWTVFTNAAGAYVFTNVAPGTYTLSAEDIYTSYTEDCDQPLEIVGSSGTDTCLVIIEP